MLFFPIVLKSSFSRYYIIAGPSDSLPRGWNAQSKNLVGCASSFVDELEASDAYWRQLLVANSYINLRRTRQSSKELVAGLLERGKIQAYEVPSPDDLYKLVSCALINEKTGIRYVFLPGNAHLLVETSHRHLFKSLKDVDIFFAAMPLSDSQLNTLAPFLDPALPTRLSTRRRLAQALVDGSLKVGVAPARLSAKPNDVVLRDVP